MGAKDLNFTSECLGSKARPEPDSWATPSSQFLPLKMGVIMDISDEGDHSRHLILRGL